MMVPRILVIALIALVAALGSGCGGGDNDNNAATNTTTQPAQPSGGAEATTVSMKEYEFTPSDVTAKKGSTITVDNKGNIAHNLTVEKGGKKVAGTSTFLGGKSEKLKVSIQAGKYTMLCTVPGHEQLGMKGTFTVK